MNLNGNIVGRKEGEGKQTPSNRDILCSLAQLLEVMRINPEDFTEEAYRVALAVLNLNEIPLGNRQDLIDEVQLRIATLHTAGQQLRYSLENKPKGETD